MPDEDPEASRVVLIFDDDENPIDVHSFPDAVEGALSMISALHSEALRLNMPESVVMGLKWIKDDIAGVGADAVAFAAKKRRH